MIEDRRPGGWRGQVLVALRERVDVIREASEKR